MYRPRQDWLDLHPIVFWLLPFLAPLDRSRGRRERPVSRPRPDLRGIPRRGLGDDPGLAFVLEPIAVALDLDDMAVMEEPVEQGSGERAVAC